MRHTGNRILSAIDRVAKLCAPILCSQRQAENLINCDHTTDQACGNNKTMGIRKCLQCDGELVMAFRPSQIGRLIPGTDNVAKSNATWRCSTCGQSFTSEQVRAGKRAALRPVEQT